MKRILLLLFVGMCFLFSCELDPTVNNEITSDYLKTGSLDSYVQNSQIVRVKGKPGITEVPIGSADLWFYEKCFVLYVATGDTKETAVSSAIIKLDGLEVLNTSDFSKNNGRYSFEVCNLTPTSVLTVEVRGAPGSYLNVWIDGKKSASRLTFIDNRDGKIYKSVKIGNQTWMAENLAYLPAVYPPEDNSFTDLRYYVYDYQGTDKEQAEQTENYKNWGVLYNAIAATQGNVCPDGWHLPSDDEWWILANFIRNDLGLPEYLFWDGPYSAELRAIGGYMKTINGWLVDPNFGNTDVYGYPIIVDDIYGFSGKPAGIINCYPLPNNTWFDGATAWFGCWSSTTSSWEPYCPIYDPTWDPAWSKTTYHEWFTCNIIGYYQIYKTRSATMGNSIRCVKDN